MIETITDLSRFCIHTITTKPWNIEVAAPRFAANGIKRISVWCDVLAGRNNLGTGRMMRDNNREIVSLCRGGFSPDMNTAKKNCFG